MEERRAPEPGRKRKAHEEAALGYREVRYGGHRSDNDVSAGDHRDLGMVQKKLDALRVYDEKAAAKCQAPHELAERERGRKC